MGLARTLAALVIGVGLLTGGYYLYTFTEDLADRQRDAIDDATAVDARVVESSITVTDSDDEADRTYETNVRFVYDFEGETYRSDHVHPSISGKSFSTESGAQEFRNEYAEGTNVTAYVDPARPGEAFLVNRPQTAGHWANKFVAAGLAFWGLLFTVGGILQAVPTPWQ